MTHDPNLSPEVGEDVAATIVNQARRDALLQLATSDLLSLAQHGDIDLLKAVRDLNTKPDSPDSYRIAHQLQSLRVTVRSILMNLGFEQAIVSEPTSEIDQPRRRVRPPMVDVELP